MDVARTLVRAAPHIPFEIRIARQPGHRFGAPEPRFTVHAASDDRIERALDLGWLSFFASYLEGEIEVVGDLEAVAELGLSRALDVRIGGGRILARSWALARVLRTATRAWRDAMPVDYSSTSFFELMLDSSLTFSAARFPGNARELGLEEAQEQKHESIASALDLQSGDQVVDIGC